MKKLVTTALVITLLFVTYVQFEPQTVGAATDSDEIIVSLTVESGISITAAADVTMSNMGVTVDASTGSATWNVKTNDPAGYTLGVRATTSPALHNGPIGFADYTEAVPGTPDTWSVDAGEFEFGFSGFGSDVVNVNSDEYAATGQTACDNGVASSTINATLRYEGFTTSDETLATRTSTTTTAGVDTTICFAAEQNGVYAPAGLYEATIVATATTI